MGEHNRHVGSHPQFGGKGEFLRAKNKFRGRRLRYDAYRKVIAIKTVFVRLFCNAQIGEEGNYAWLLAATCDNTIFLRN